MCSGVCAVYQHPSLRSPAWSAKNTVEKPAKKISEAHRYYIREAVGEGEGQRLGSRGVCTEVGDVCP